MSQTLKTPPNRMNCTRLSLALIGVFLMVGCKPQISDKDIVKLNVAQAREYILHPPTSSIFETGLPGIWIDPRRQPDYVLGHIPGAVNVPFATVSSQYEFLQGYGAKIVYGDTYNDPLADAMSKTLMELGLSDIYTLRGGVDAWTEAHLDLEKGASPELETHKPPRKRRIRH
jgi:3-mercaptopyruvate sulfurtransferase SseA